MDTSLSLSKTNGYVGRLPALRARLHGFCEAQYHLRHDLGPINAKQVVEASGLAVFSETLRAKADGLGLVERYPSALPIYGSGQRLEPVAQAF